MSSFVFLDANSICFHLWGDKMSLDTSKVPWGKATGTHWYYAAGDTLFEWNYLEKLWSTLMLYLMGWFPAPVNRMYPSSHCLITAFAYLTCLMNSVSCGASFSYSGVYHGGIQKASGQSRTNRFQSTELESLGSGTQMLVAHTYLGGSGTSWRGVTDSCVPKRPKPKSYGFSHDFPKGI